MKTAYSKGWFAFFVVSLGAITIVLSALLVTCSSRNESIGIQIFDPILWKELAASGSTAGLVNSTSSIPLHQSLLGFNIRISDDESHRGADPAVIVRTTLVDMVKRAKRPSKSTFRNKDRMLELLDQLDVTSFRSSFGPMHVSRINQSVSSFSSEVTTTEYALLIESVDWTYQIEVVAAGDFDGDCHEDLLVLFCDAAKEGSYNVTQPLLLTRPYGEVISATELPLLVVVNNQPR